ncbi:MAG TPA: aquaporin [Phycisphaerales bacterium]|nr:aquaporin [Phycisphaerales bacterium]
MNKLLTEAIGTFFLVFIICLVVATAAPMAPLFIGLGLMVMVFMGGPISGAHFNPAVTLAVLMRGKISPPLAARYVLSQLLGALLAAFLASFIANKTIPIARNPEFTLAAALLVEAIFTFALALVVLNVATVKSSANNSYYGLAIGMTVAAAAAAGGGISGGAFNPAVGLGIGLVSTIKTGADATHLWIYIAMPLLGGALAALTFKAQHGATAD